MGHVEVLRLLCNDLGIKPPGFLSTTIDDRDDSGTTAGLAGRHVAWTEIIGIPAPTLDLKFLARSGSAV